MPAVECQPVKVIVFLERFGGAAGEVVTLSAAVVGEDSIGKCDLLKLLFGGFL